MHRSIGYICRTISDTDSVIAVIANWPFYAGHPNIVVYVTLDITTLLGFAGNWVNTCISTGFNSQL